MKTVAKVLALFGILFIALMVVSVLRGYHPLSLIVYVSWRIFRLL